jgi:glycerol uptake facilitator-like aquaporin
LANPAVTFARMFSESFAGIAPESVPMFVVMQIVGFGIATGILTYLVTSES